MSTVLERLKAKEAKRRETGEDKIRAEAVYRKVIIKESEIRGIVRDVVRELPQGTSHISVKRLVQMVSDSREGNIDVAVVEKVVKEMYSVSMNVVSLV